MEKEKLKELARKSARLGIKLAFDDYMGQYAIEVKREMFTKEELEHLMEIELDYQEKTRDPLENEPLDERLIEKLEKLTELTNLSEEKV